MGQKMGNGFQAARREKERQGWILTYFGEWADSCVPDEERRIGGTSARDEERQWQINRHARVTSRSVARRSEMRRAVREGS